MTKTHIEWPAPSCTTIDSLSTGDKFFPINMVGERVGSLAMVITPGTTSFYVVDLVSGRCEFVGVDTVVEPVDVTIQVGV